MSEENPNALKHIYNKELLIKISDEIYKVYPKFDKKYFLSILKPMLKLEMKDRVRLIRDHLKETLPSKYSESLSILLKSTEAGQLTGFALWPYTEFIQIYGLEDIKKSLLGLKKLTILFTSEWAVRPFIKKDLEYTLDFLKSCALDSNHHVRRWVSEGSRPRLPWGERLHVFIKDPKLSCELIEPLIFDSELYVRKSVANHMNDITKDHPELAVSVLAKWKKSVKTNDQQVKLDWIIKHALRSLIKEGHTGALNLIGISSKVKLEIDKFKIVKNNIKMGEKIEFDFKIKSLSSKPQQLIIDYVIHFAKANGKTAPKVFKLKNINLKPLDKVSIAKIHSIKPISTRKYYSGEHLLELQINGQKFKKLKWTLSL